MYLGSIIGKSGERQKDSNRGRHVVAPRHLALILQSPCSSGINRHLHLQLHLHRHHKCSSAPPLLHQISRCSASLASLSHRIRSPASPHGRSRAHCSIITTETGPDAAQVHLPRSAVCDARDLEARHPRAPPQRANLYA